MELKEVLMLIGLVLGLLACSEFVSDDQPSDYYGPEDCTVVWYQTGPECE